MALKVVVTGASSGVGKALATRLARDKVRLYLVGRNAEALKAVAADCINLGASSVDIGIGDVGRAEDVQRIWAAWGSPAIDVLCANAGLNRTAKIDEYTEEEYDAIMNTNVKGVWLWMRQVLPGMRAAGRGQLVITSSVLGLRPPQGSGASLYCASKYALQGLVGAARNELSGTNIKIATVNPAGIDSPWWSDSSRGGKRDKPVATSTMLPPEVVAEVIASVIHQHPLADMNEIIIDNAKPQSFGEPPPAPPALPAAAAAAAAPEK